MAAADILADLHLDADTIVAAILHDVIEDTPTPKDQLAARFGADVAELVDGVTKLDQIKFKSREEAQAESFRKMLLAMVRDLRVILVKLADRTHNMRTHRGDVAAAAAARSRARRSRSTRRSPSASASTTSSSSSRTWASRRCTRSATACIERALKRARGNQKEFLEQDRAAAARGAA